MTHHELLLRDFWRAAYLQAMERNFDDPAGEADKAMVEYDSRFAPIEEPAPAPEPQLDQLG